MVTLCDLGLSSYEQKAFRALLEIGPATASDVSEESGVPEGRIYDVLNGLESRDVVRSQTASRPRKYVAVDPDVAIDRLLESKRRELAAERDRYESVADQLRTRLDRAVDTTDRFWTAAVGPDDAFELWLERVESADDRIGIVSDRLPAERHRVESGNRAIDALGRAVERGVEVSILLPEPVLTELPPDLFTEVDREPFTDDAFAVRTTPELHGGFNVIDHREVCFEVANPLDPNAPFAMIDLRDPGFAAEVETTYDRLWESGTPLAV